MDRHTNEIRSFTPTTNHIPIDSANFTMINSQQVTTEEATAFDHIDTTDAQNLHDCINRLGYGNCKYFHLQQVNILKLSLNV